MEYVRKIARQKSAELAPLLIKGLTPYQLQLPSWLILGDAKLFPSAILAGFPGQPDSESLAIVSRVLALPIVPLSTFDPPLMTESQLKIVRSSELPDVKLPCPYFSYAYYKGAPVKLFEIFLLDDFKNSTAQNYHIVAMNIYLALTLTPPASTSEVEKLDVVPEEVSVEVAPSVESLESGAVEQPLEVKENVVAPELPPLPPVRVIKRLAPVKKGDGLSEAGGFLEELELYSMHEYLSSVREGLTSDEWDKVKVAVEGLKGVAPILDKIGRLHHFLDVAVGDNEAMSSAIKTMDEIGIMHEARTLREVQQVDHVLARLPQSAASSETFLRINSKPIAGEFVSFLNLFDDEHPIYCTIDSDQQLAYLRAASVATDRITAYVRKNSPGDIGNVPKTTHFAKKLTSEQLDYVQDLQISRKKNDPTSVTLKMSGHGGELFGKNEKKATYVTLKPLAALVVSGLPPVLAIKDIYAQDVKMREVIGTAFVSRAKKRAALGVNHCPEWSELDAAFWGGIGVDEEGELLSLKMDYEEPKLDDAFHLLMDEIHHMNRSQIVYLSTDLGAFQAVYARMTTLPSETLAIRMASDIYLEGFDVDLVDAEDYLAFGSLASSTCRSRAPCYPGQDVSVNVDYHVRFDKKKNEKRAILNMENKSPMPIYVGGGTTFPDKITEGPNEKRQVQYWQYEKIVSELGADQKMTHYREKPEDSPLYLEAKRTLEQLGKAYERAVVVCPLRHAPILIKTYNVVMALPAPQPFMFSAVLFVQHSPTKERVEMENLYELAILLDMKQKVVVQTFRTGSVGYDALLAKKLSPEDISTFNAFLVFWQQKNKVRYVDSNVTGIKIKKRLQKLLKSDPSGFKRQGVDNMSLYGMADTRSFSVKTKNKTKRLPGP